MTQLYSVDDNYDALKTEPLYRGRREVEERANVTCTCAGKGMKNYVSNQFTRNTSSHTIID